jgi:hypothetical protein
VRGIHETTSVVVSICRLFQSSYKQYHELQLPALFFFLVGELVGSCGGMVSSVFIWDGLYIIKNVWLLRQEVKELKQTQQR